MRPARHLHVPLAQDRIHRDAADEGVLLAPAVLQGVAEVVGVGDVGADGFRHRGLHDPAVVVGQQHVVAEVGQGDGAVAPGVQVEVRRIGLPGADQDAQRLVQLEKLPVDLVLETDSLVGDTGENAGLRFLPLGLDGTVGAEPGDGDKAEGRQDDQGGA